MWHRLAHCGGRSSQATPAAVDKSQRTSHTEILTPPTHHLGYPPGADRPDDASNHRNGSTAKTVLTDTGPLRIADLAGPSKHHRRLGPSSKRLEGGHEPIRDPLC